MKNRCQSLLFLSRRRLLLSHLDQKNPNETEVAKLLAKQGMTWIEPTHATFKEIGDAAKKPKKQPESQPKTPPATKPSKKAPGNRK